ncbi:hypothetical protein E2C01_010199 [Portunus trituberculatus]|uniref:Uncharacterized protein n=1 Tax=Portunus trituberculatus TaxID=210409 RepID=A0A5B7D7Z7_PORTR|nr:hypothetical protein [Portunus trituberculatus]
MCPLHSFTLKQPLRWLSVRAAGVAVWHRRRGQDLRRDNMVSTGRHNKHHHPNHAACCHSTIPYAVLIQRALPGRLDGWFPPP